MVSADQQGTAIEQNPSPWFVFALQMDGPKKYNALKMEKIGRNLTNRIGRREKLTRGWP